MSDTICAATGCGYPTRDHLLCTVCQDTLARDLTDLPDLLADLDLTLAKLGVTNLAKTRTSSRALPYDERASDVAHTTHQAIAEWIDQIIGDTETPPTSEASADWLAARRYRIIDHPKADQACDTFATIRTEILRVTDRPPAKVYAGICGSLTTPTLNPGDGYARGGIGHYRCDEPLYAWPDAPTVRCRGCSTIHDVQTRRDNMLTHLDTMLFTAAEIAGMGTYLGELTGGRERARKLINKWHQRGRLAAHGTNPNGTPTFLFGETMAMIARSQDTQQTAG